MKKRLITGILAATMVGATVFGLAACGKEKTGTAYGMVHQSYVGVADVTRKGDKVTDVKIEEYFTPGQFTVNANLPADTNTVIVHTNDHGDTTKPITQIHVEYIKIGDEVFKATVSGTEASNAQTIAYEGKANGTAVTDILAWLKDSARTQDDYKWYVEACRAEKVKYMKNATEEITDVKVTYSGSNAKLEKTSSTYWNMKDDTKRGWPENIDALVTWVKANGVTWKDNVATTDITRDANKIPTVDGVSAPITGVTLGYGATAEGDLNQYLNVIKIAYNNAK
jgi:hypothetical protein